MQLGINGWPPVASHMACLVLGVALAHLSRGAGKAPARIPKRGIVLSVAAPPGSVAAAPPAAPQRVFVAEQDTQGRLCRLTDDPVERLPASGWTLVLPLTAAAQVAPLLKALRASTTKLLDEAQGRSVAPCGKGPKVIYGMP